MGLLDGKKGLVLNIANDRSIAWHIANNAIQHGATCGFGYLPMEKMERRVRKSLEEMAVKDPWLQPCDVDTLAFTVHTFRSMARQSFWNPATSIAFQMPSTPAWRIAMTSLS